jgi:hypothetical protein
VTRRRGVIIDGNDAMTITLRALTIQHGNATDISAGGGGIYVISGTLVVEDSRVLSSTASAGGAGIYLSRGHHIVRNSVLTHNNTDANGGGIFLSGGQLLMTETTLQANSADWGGGVYAQNLIHLTVKGCRFLDNSSQEGGGLAAGLLPDSRAYVYGNTFHGNHGGGAWIRYGYSTFWMREQAIVSNNIFQGNVGDSGGGLYVSVEHLSLVDNRFVENESSYLGGGLSAGGETVLMHGNAFEYNYAASDGGGAYVYAYTPTLSSNTVVNNTAGGAGGGMLLSGVFDSLLRDNFIRGNTAISAGSGLAITNGDWTAMNDVIAQNSGPFEGVFVTGGSLSAAHWTLVDNGDYALTTDGGSATLTNTIIVTHSVGGLAGPSIEADYALVVNSGMPCSSGAVCRNIFTGNPRFIDAPGGDCHIGPDSAAIDVGTPAGVGKDMDNEPRLGIPDLGADEYWAPDAIWYSVHLPIARRSAP